VSKYPSDSYAPRPDDHFTWGLWTVGNRGRDPFGDAVRASISPTRIVEKLAELGAYGVNLHDNDLIPFDATPADRDRIVKEFKQALQSTDMRVPMATTNLFYDPIFKEGAFTANDARVRAYSLQKTMRAMDLGVELGATTYVFWGGREGVETNAAKAPQEALKRFREALDFLCEYALANKYDLKFALEAKPNEPRGDIFLPTSGHMLACASRAKTKKAPSSSSSSSRTASGPACATSTATPTAPRTRRACGTSPGTACART